MNQSFANGFSIVLCTYNGQPRLEPTLTHLAALSIPAGYRAELIIVNNASTDATEAFAKKIWLQLGQPFPLIVLNESRSGKGYAVETGYDAAAYSYIVTVDDDNWLDSNYLQNAAALFSQHPDAGILQAHNTGEFEQEPPSWVKELKAFFIIGSPINEPGYFSENNFFVWGAGMVLKKEDWAYLRTLNFSFLTSKIAGKAAGEDNELAIALLLLGRKIYYSDKLNYKHYMPANRMTWSKLKQNFEVFGYVNYYFLLYALVIESYQNGYPLTKRVINKKYRIYIYKYLRRYTWKQHLAYWVYRRQEYYQLRMSEYYNHYKWFIKLSKNAMQDIGVIQSWVHPLLKNRSATFKWPVEIS